MPNEKKQVGTIDLTPTWSALLPAMLEVLENNAGDNSAKQIIREEFARMARAADAYNARPKEKDPRAIKCDWCGVETVYVGKSMREVASEHKKDCGWAMYHLGKAATIPPCPKSL